MRSAGTPRASASALRRGGARRTKWGSTSRPESAHAFVASTQPQASHSQRPGAAVRPDAGPLPRSVIKTILQFCKENSLPESFAAIQRECQVSLNTVESLEGFVADITAGRWDVVLPAVAQLKLPRTKLEDLYELVRPRLPARPDTVSAVCALPRDLLELVAFQTRPRAGLALAWAPVRPAPRRATSAGSQVSRPEPNARSAHRPRGSSRASWPLTGRKATLALSAALCRRAIPQSYHRGCRTWEPQGPSAGSPEGSPRVAAGARAQVVLELVELREVDTARAMLRQTAVFAGMKQEEPDRFLRLEHLCGRAYFDVRRGAGLPVGAVRRL